jgi:NAD(P)-dependent dehydrogenase (short-subunit alcohol dehydrogenase family)
MMAANYPFSVDGNEFRGKRVLVTGGTKGMGEAIVRRLTMGGALVATTARSSLPEGQKPALFVQKHICGSPAINRRLEHLQPLRDARVKSVLHVFFVAEKVGDGHFSA